MTEQEIRANRAILRAVPPVEGGEVERAEVVVGEAAGSARISSMFAAAEHVGRVGVSVLRRGGRVQAGGGGVCLCSAYGCIAAGGFLHGGGDDVAGDYYFDARGAGERADVISRSVLESGGVSVADDPHDCAAQFDQRNFDGCDFAGFAGGGRDSAD